ncbi:MAG TPA: radical SAM protein [Firmicutes bacterium]|nr:radical SAM protein [Bacillota bacterium]
MPSVPVLARAALHTGEEPCISGTRGSGAVFFSGCPLGCVYCQNEPISRGRFGKAVTPARLADIFRELEAQGAHNINLVNPTHFVPAILEALEQYRPAVPVVYNSSGYERVETLRRLEGAVDVYLPDLKYADSGLAARLSGAPDYFDYAAPAILEMARQTGPMALDGEGIARRGTLIRHLLLPGHTRNTIAVLDWLRDNKPDGVWLSLMFQYTPVNPEPPDPALARRVTARECRKVWDALLERGLTDGYVQDRASATTAYIPEFDLTGV